MGKDKVGTDINPELRERLLPENIDRSGNYEDKLAETKKTEEAAAAEAKRKEEENAAARAAITNQGALVAATEKKPPQSAQIQRSNDAKKAYSKFQWANLSMSILFGLLIGLSIAMIVIAFFPVWAALTVGGLCWGGFSWSSSYFEGRKSKSLLDQIQHHVDPKEKSNERQTITPVKKHSYLKMATLFVFPLVLATVSLAFVPFLAIPLVTALIGACIFLAIAAAIGAAGWFFHRAKNKQLTELQRLKKDSDDEKNTSRLSSTLTPAPHPAPTLTKEEEEAKQKELEQLDRQIARSQVIRKVIVTGCTAIVSAFAAAAAVYTVAGVTLTGTLSLSSVATFGFITMSIASALTFGIAAAVGALVAIGICGIAWWNHRKEKKAIDAAKETARTQGQPYIPPPKKSGGALVFLGYMLSTLALITVPIVRVGLAIAMGIGALISSGVALWQKHKTKKLKAQRQAIIDAPKSPPPAAASEKSLQPAATLTRTTSTDSFMDSHSAVLREHHTLHTVPTPEKPQRVRSESDLTEEEKLTKKKTIKKPERAEADTVDIYKVSRF